MATIIRLRGVNFNNPSLPVISSFVRNGLIGAFRPAGDESSLVDLSGNGVTLTQAGTPVFTETALQGNGGNGFITNIAETASLTIIAVARGVQRATSFDGFMAGCYHSFSLSSTERRGTSLWFDENAGTGAGLIDVSLNSQAFVEDGTSPGAFVNKVQSGYKILDESDPAVDTETPWAFVAMTINADTEVRRHYTPNYVTTGPAIEVDEGALGNALSTRLLADPSTSEPNYMHLVSTPEVTKLGSTSWQGCKIELAEALFYNRALTSEEIFQQYELSKDFMLKVRGITI